MRLYTFLAKCQAWTASPMCKDPATALRVPMPINRGNEVPRKVAWGANELNIGNNGSVSVSQSHNKEGYVLNSIISGEINLFH